MNKRQVKKARKKQLSIMKFIELKHRYENIYHFYIWNEWVKGEENGN